MGRELIIAWAGRRRRDDWERLCGRYRRRIAERWQIRDLPVRVREASGDDPGRRRKEAAALLGALPSPCRRVALDSRGKPRTSEELATWLVELRERWPHPVAFLIGSDLGLEGEVLHAADETLSLGPLTFPHELARLVLYEQIYRAVCIDARISYHRGLF